jgi:hypothetical protein
LFGVLGDYAVLEGAGVDGPAVVFPKSGRTGTLAT